MCSASTSHADRPQNDGTRRIRPLSKGSRRASSFYSPLASSASPCRRVCLKHPKKRDPESSPGSCAASWEPTARRPRCGRCEGRLVRSVSHASWLSQGHCGAHAWRSVRGGDRAELVLCLRLPCAAEASQAWRGEPPDADVRERWHPLRRARDSRHCRAGPGHPSCGYWKEGRFKAATTAERSSCRPDAAAGGIDLYCQRETHLMRLPAGSVRTRRPQMSNRASEVRCGIAGAAQSCGSASPPRWEPPWFVREADGKG